jgi:ATP-binding cassette subfamily C protein
VTLAGRLLHFFDRRDRLRALGLLALMLLGAAFEALGIAAVLPFVALIDDPQALERYAVLRRLYETSGLASTRTFLIWCGVALIAVYSFKALYLAGLAYLQYRFIVDAQVALSRRLLSAYLASPYAFHLQRNSAELQRVLNSDMLLVFNNVVVPTFRMLIELMVVAAVMVMLIVVAPAPALLAIAVLGGASVGFYAVIRKTTASFGKAQTIRFGEMIQWVNQALGGVKEAKVLGRERFFVDAYARSSAEYARAARFFGTAAELPRLGIESFAVVGMLLVIVLLLLREQDLRRLIPTFGLFALAAVRLMPSLNRIVAGVTAMRFFHASIDALYQDLTDLEARPPAALPDQPTPAVPPTAVPGGARLARAIELRRVSFRYPGGHEPALDDVSLTIERGQSVAFVGPSGSGKSTLIDVMLGLLPATAGQILVDGVDIHDDLRAWQGQLGYVPQAVYLLDDTIRRNVAFALADEAIDDRRVWDALAAAQLADFVGGLPEGLDALVGEQGVRLSGGQRQRIGIARAIYHDPAVLVLDEATSAVDGETERAILRGIAPADSGRTVILIAHRLTTIEDCDALFVLKRGRLVASGPFAELLELSDDFRSLARTMDAAPEATDVRA